MAEAPIIYQKLPGSRRTLIEHVRLFLGPDHLLQVTTMFFQQTYKRFYFADIQAIQIRKTDAANTWNIVLTGGTFFFAVLALVFGDIALWVLGSIAASFLAGLLANLASGSTAVAHIQTAVQTEQLRSLARLSQARKFLARIQPLIQTAQAHPHAASPAPPTAGAEEARPVIDPGTPSPTPPNSATEDSIQ